MTRALEYAVTLLDCLTAAYEEVEPEFRPGQICLRHGTQGIPLLGTGADECCNGLAWVRVATVEPRYDRNESVAACFPSTEVITLEIGAVFCMPWGSVQAPPTCDQWTQVAVRADSDRGAMKAAVCCARGIIAPEYTMLAQQYLPYGPDGNCIGGTMTITVEADCGCA